MTLTQAEIEEQLADLQSRVAELEESAAPANTGPNGEDLSPTETNPVLDQDQPGVEPLPPVEGEGAPNAPASANPEGDTAKQNAPVVAEPEPGAPGTTGNPGTDSPSDAQTEVPPGTTSDTPPASAEPNPPPGEAGQPVQSESAAESSAEKVLYVNPEVDPANVPDGLEAAGFHTPDGVELYHLADSADSAPEGFVVYATPDDAEVQVVPGKVPSEETAS